METQNNIGLLHELYRAEKNALVSSSGYQRLSQMKKVIEAHQYEPKNAQKEVIKGIPYACNKLSSDVQENYIKKASTSPDVNYKLEPKNYSNSKQQPTHFGDNLETTKRDKTTYCRPTKKSNKNRVIVENKPKLQKFVKLLAEARRKEKQKNAWDVYIWKLRLKHKMTESETHASLCKPFKQNSLPEKLYEELYSTMFKINPTIDTQVLPQELLNDATALSYSPSSEYLHNITQQRWIASVTRHNPYQVNPPTLKSKEHVSSNIQSHFCSSITSWKNYALDSWGLCEEVNIKSSESELHESVHTYSLLSVSLSDEKSNEVNIEKISNHSRKESVGEMLIHESSQNSSLSWKSVQESEDGMQYKLINKIRPIEKKQHDEEKHDRCKNIWSDYKISEIGGNTQTLKKVQKTKLSDTIKLEPERKNKTKLVKKRSHEPMQASRTMSIKKTCQDKKENNYDVTRTTDEFTSESWSTRVLESARGPESLDVTDLGEEENDHINAGSINDNSKSESEREMLTPESEITPEPSVVSRNHEPLIIINRSPNKIQRDNVPVRSNCGSNEKWNCKVCLSKVEKQDEEAKLLSCRRRIQELLEEAYRGLKDKLQYSRDSSSETVKEEDEEIIICYKIRKPSLQKILQESQKESTNILRPKVEDEKKQHTERIFLLRESLKRMRPHTGKKSTETLRIDSSELNGKKTFGQSMTTRNHKSKIYQQERFKSKYTGIERMRDEDYCRCGMKVRCGLLKTPQKGSADEISKTPQCSCKYSTIYETNEDDIKELKSNMCICNKNQKRQLADIRPRNSLHYGDKQSVYNVHPAHKISSEMKMKIDENTVMLDCESFQSLLSECVQTDDKLIDLEEILEEELNKSNRAIRDIDEILGGEPPQPHQSELRLCMDMPTRDCCTKTTESLWKTCRQPCVPETRDCCTKTTDSLCETCETGCCDAERERVLTVAVNTEPLSFLALFELSKEAAGRLLAYARFTCSNMLPIPSPFALRFPLSSYRFIIRNTDTVPQLASIKAWRRQQADPQHFSATSRSIPSNDCCVCRHLLERQLKRPVGIFKCKYCGKGFIRAYCRDLHEQKCAHDSGKEHDLSLNLSILR